MDIPTNNTVNGRPVYYYTGSGIVVPLNAGEVILGGCTNVSVDDLNLSEQDIGLVIGFSQGVAVDGCRFDNNTDYGLRFYASNDCVVQNDRFAIMEDGVYSELSYDLSVLKNNISGTSNGIYLYDSHDIVVQENNITASDIGIRCEDSHSLTVTNNQVSGPECSYGIYLQTVTSSLVDNNTISGAEDGLHYYYDVDTTVSENNTFIDCSCAIYVYDCDSGSLDFHCNQIAGSDYGLQLQASGNIHAFGNTIDGATDGVDVFSSHDILLDNNTITNCTSVWSRRIPAAAA